MSGVAVETGAGSRPSAPSTAATPTGLPGVHMLNLWLWQKPTLVVFPFLQTQESGGAAQASGGLDYGQGLPGDAGRKGVIRGFASGEIKEGKQSERGRRRRDEARVVWTGCPQASADGGVWFLQGMEEWGG